MSFGSSPLGSTPLGERPLRATFDLQPQNIKHSVVEVVSFFGRKLIEELGRRPHDLRLIGRRDFEHLVAELFVGFGYEVELTQKTRDGGKDIIAIKRQEVNLRYLIECKRPDPGNPVGVSLVRELWGVKSDDNASKAILATTTYFSPDARKFEERNKWELELKDYDAVVDWIRMYNSQPRP